MRVELSDVTRSFGDRDVLRGLSCTIETATSVAVMGPSGSGKSTLLAVLAGLLEPTSGRRTVVDGDHGHVRCAWILQAAQLLPRRTALANVALGPLLAGCPRMEAQDRALAALADVDMGQLVGSAAYQLSGGERQRVAVARAIASQADLVLADEPTASLDGENRALVCDALMAAVRSGCGVVVATHDAAVAERCARVLELHGGSVRSRG